MIPVEEKLWVLRNSVRSALSNARDGGRQVNDNSREEARDLLANDASVLRQVENVVAALVDEWKAVQRSTHDTGGR